jgi:hypothetical protein
MLNLKPSQLQDIYLLTAFPPPLSILHNGQWEDAPSQTAATAPDVARIFDPLAVNSSGQSPSIGYIPLHPDHPNYFERRYWRLPKRTLGGILSAAILRAMDSPATGEELEMVRDLHDLLTLKMGGNVDAGLRDEGHRKGGGDGGRRGGKKQREISQKIEVEGEGIPYNTRSSNRRHRR